MGNEKSGRTFRLKQQQFAIFVSSGLFHSGCSGTSFQKSSDETRTLDRQDARQDHRLQERPRSAPEAPRLLNLGFSGEIGSSLTKSFTGPEMADLSELSNKTRPPLG